MKKNEKVINYEDSDLIRLNFLIHACESINTRKKQLTSTRLYTRFQKQRKGLT